MLNAQYESNSSEFSDLTPSEGRKWVIRNIIIRFTISLYNYIST